LVALAIQLQDLVEDPPWVEYESRVRLPSNIPRQPHHARQDRFRWYAVAVAEADKFRNEDKPATKLFYWEDKLGRTLLHVETTDGLYVPKVIHRQTPSEEVHLDPAAEEGREAKELWWVDGLFGWTQ